MNKKLQELYVTFGVATILFFLIKKKFARSPPPSQSLSPDILTTDPMELCPLCPPSDPTMDTSPRFVVQPMSEDESSSEDYVIKEKFY